MSTEKPILPLKPWNVDDVITAARLNDLVNAINGLLPAPGPGVVQPSMARGFWAKLTGAAVNGLYPFAEQQQDGQGNWVTNANGTSGQAATVNDSAAASGDIVWVTPHVSPDGATITYWFNPGGAGFFPVLVWQDDGAAGNATTQCTMTYTVRTTDATGIATGGTLLGATMHPAWPTGRQRPTVGLMLCPPATGAGVVGIGYYDATGAFQLYDANETPDASGDCT